MFYLSQINILLSLEIACAVYIFNLSMDATPNRHDQCVVVLCVCIVSLFTLL